MEAQGAAEQTRLDGRAWARIGAAWLVVALAWAPAVYLTEPAGQRGGAAFAAAFVQILIHFAPWALATPLFLRLSRRFPVGLGSDARGVTVFLLLGAVLIPAFTAAGVVAMRLIVAAVSDRTLAESLAGIGPPILITGLFAIPTYIALVAIGQTIAYLERYRQRERLLSRARAETLRAQIAPHFLFNALNAISALGYSDPARADAAIVRLAGLLRETLERPEWTTLREEIALTADYVELHRLLLGDRLTFDLKVETQAWDARLPAMLLQPLVENALAHGISRLPEGGRLLVEASRDGPDLQILIANDRSVEIEPMAGAGIGLVNTRRRLAAAYGDRARLDFRIEENSARAELRFPYEPGPE